MDINFCCLEKERIYYMARIERFEDLLIWQDARILAGKIYNAFTASKDFGFKDQIQRAAISIMNNIAEGYERGSDAELIRFLFIAKASSGEVRSMIYLANDLNYMAKELADELMRDSIKLSRGIANFIKYLKSTK